jgi:anti-anti-sigma regulatory factor
VIDEVVIRQIGNELTKLVDDRRASAWWCASRASSTLSSAALGTMLTVMNRVKAKDGRLRLCDIAAAHLHADLRDTPS